ncbi:hypothetical protein [Rheinheimera pacifica]|uniref:hypothetical protein n=1 Tax=Rheinheimera pacifica TaxID=173990 RepID=UPI002ED7B15F
MSFAEYKFIKESMAHRYKGFDMMNIMSFDIICRTYGNDISLFRDFVASFLCKKINLPKKKSHDVLFSMGNYGRRKDYYEILEFARSSVAGDYIDISDAKWGISINIKNFFTSLSSVFKLKSSLSVTGKLSIAFMLSHYKNTIDYIERQAKEVEYNKFCSFCSAHAYEAILDEFFRLKKIPTYTLQHGLYFLFKKPPIDIIAYENMISDKLLCWGQFTKDEFVKFGIPRDRIDIVGYPRSIKDLKPYRIDDQKLSLLFLCARSKFDQTNKDIMKLCHEFIKLYPGTVKLTVKTHPSLDQLQYKQISQSYGFTFSEGQTIQSLITNGGYDFAIAYNSTAYVDSYLNNLIALHYQDAERENDAEVLDDKFSNADELMTKINAFIRLADKNEAWIDISNRLSYLVGYGINRYTEILDAKKNN